MADERQSKPSTTHCSRRTTRERLRYAVSPPLLRTMPERDVPRASKETAKVSLSEHLKGITTRLTGPKAFQTRAYTN
jgi:hypothetical protein